MDMNSTERERPAKFTDDIDMWKDLSLAIIESACKDYRKFGGSGRKAIERFIMSDYFSRISDIDQSWLIRTLRETYRPMTGMVRG